MGGGGAGGRGAQVRTNPASRAASPDPAAHREARPAGWAAEPESGTGETRAELGCRVCEDGMDAGRGESQARLSCLPSGEAGARGASVAVGTTRPAREGLAAAGCKEGAGWLGSLMGVGPALGIRIRNSGVGGGGVCFWPGLWEEDVSEWGRQKTERLEHFSMALFERGLKGSSFPRGWC